MYKKKIPTPREIKRKNTIMIIALAFFLFLTVSSMLYASIQQAEAKMQTALASNLNESIIMCARERAQLRHELKAVQDTLGKYRLEKVVTITSQSSKK